MTNPSICIPQVNKNINKNIILTAFNKHNFGKIKKINLIQSGKIQIAFIHFYCWFNTKKSLKVKNILLLGQDFKIMYDEPCYFKCVIAHNN
jgi:hypothetical protein